MATAERNRNVYVWNGRTWNCYGSESILDDPEKRAAIGYFKPSWVRIAESYPDGPPDEELQPPPKIDVPKAFLEW